MKRQPKRCAVAQSSGGQHMSMSPPECLRAQMLSMQERSLESQLRCRAVPLLTVKQVEC